MPDGVTFDDDSNNLVGNITVVPSAPKGIIAYLIKNKVVENGKQAEKFLAIIAVVAVVLAVVVIFFTYFKPVQHFTPAQIQGLESMGSHSSNP